MPHPITASLLTARDHMRTLYKAHDAEPIIRRGQHDVWLQLAGGTNHAVIIKTAAQLLAEALEWLEQHGTDHEPPDMLELVLEATWDITVLRLSDEEFEAFIESDDVDSEA